MKVCGFTFVRNAVKYDYPVIESICSILPLCDEIVVSVGNSDDDTLALIQSVRSHKIRITHSVWDDSLREGGRVLAAETDKALAQVSADADWLFYIQADEVVHEKDYGTIRAAMEQYRNDPRVQGLLFNYLHFYGSYEYVGDSRVWYRHEIRVIRRDPLIRSYRDAQGFRRDGKKLWVKPVNATIYHYGWVKDPYRQARKQENAYRLYRGNDAAALEKKAQEELFNYAKVDSLELFAGTHPQVMQQRIAARNWNFRFDVRKKQFAPKDALLYWIEKKTGKRLFDYRNYRLLR